MNAEDLRSLYRRWLLELWQGDLSVADEIIGQPFTLHRTRGGGSTDTLAGPEGVAEMVRGGLEYFSNVTISIDVGPVADGDLVAAQWTWRGDYQGGIPNTTAPVGTGVTFNGSEILRAEAGKLVEYWVCTDDLSFMTQLGAFGGE